jgi:NAD-dependent SIR2 family protein deacetylase
VDEARALLVAGSSLTVYSGRRFVIRARDRGIPVAIVNRGQTRGDAMADVRVHAGCSEALAAAWGEISGSALAPSLT